MNYPISYAADFGQRDPAPGVDALFVERWSPRAMRKVEIPRPICARFSMPRAGRRLATTSSPGAS
ncbi:MAG: hypothetical protein IPH23_13375 [Gammaproteobacteria bacterium]|nr:hypothetical protein [Gammaproteobacteria bacterium]